MHDAGVVEVAQVVQGQEAVGWGVDLENGVLEGL